MSCSVCSPRAVKICASRISPASSTSTAPGEADWMAEEYFAAPFVVLSIIFFASDDTCVSIAKYAFHSGLARIEGFAYASDLCY